MNEPKASALGESRIPVAYQDTLDKQSQGATRPVGSARGLFRRFGDELRRRPALWAGVTLCTAQIAAAAWHLWLARGSTYYAEELGYAKLFRGVHSGLIDLWAGWFFPLTRLVYNLVFATVGLRNHFPVQLFGLACNVVLVWVVFWYCRRINRPWSGALVGVFLLTFGYATETILLPAMAYNTIGVAAFPAALMMMSQDRRRSDLQALVLIFVAIGFAGPVALPACVGLAIWLLLQRPVAWQRLRIPAIPVLTYTAIYFLAEATGHTISGSSGGIEGGFAYLPLYLLGSPIQIVALASNMAAALSGIARPDGAIFLPIGLVAFVIGFRRIPRGVRGRVIALSVTALSAWLLVAATRGYRPGIPEAQRYVLYGAVPVLLIGVHMTASLGRRGRSVVVALVLLSMALNAAALTRFAAQYRLINEIQRARYTALDLAGDRVPADYWPGANHLAALDFVDARGWLEIKRRLGSIAFSPTEIPQAAPFARGELDRVLREIGHVKISRAIRPRPGDDDSSCTSSTGRRELRVPSSGFRLIAKGSEQVAIKLRRFGDYYPEAAYAFVDPGKVVSVVPVGDSIQRPWKAQVIGRSASCSIIGSSQAG